MWDRAEAAPAPPAVPDDGAPTAAEIRRLVEGHGHAQVGERQAGRRCVLGAGLVVQGLQSGQ